MRRTLWLVQSPHLAMLPPGASDHVADTERRRLIADVEKAGVADDGAAIPALAGTFDPAPGKRWGGATPLAPRVLTVLSVRGDLLRGPNEGSWTNSRPGPTASGSAPGSRRLYRNLSVRH
ncbi:hypothetical protein BH09ACT8_BH09ACT8_20970 [soil metagenome]